MKRPRMDVNLEELDRVLEQAREAPLSEPDYEKLESALHALAGMLAKPRTTEKTKNVLEQPETPAPENDSELPADKTGCRFTAWKSWDIYSGFRYGLRRNGRSWKKRRK